MSVMIDLLLEVDFRIFSPRGLRKAQTRWRGNSRFFRRDLGRQRMPVSAHGPSAKWRHASLRSAQWGHTELVIGNASSSHYMIARISVEESACGEYRC